MNPAGDSARCQPVPGLGEPGPRVVPLAQLMIDLGYMAKRIAARPGWLAVDHVRDIYAVANCISDDFCDYIQFWKHNGFWFFDSVARICEVADEAGVNLAGTRLVYYRGYEQQYDARRRSWTEYFPDDGFRTAVSPPAAAKLLGYDVVTYSQQNVPECSPLSCNHLASEIRVNEHCLIDSPDYAIERLETGAFNNSEPGPYRILAVNALEWPETWRDQRHAAEAARAALSRSTGGTPCLQR